MISHHHEVEEKLLQKQHKCISQQKESFFVGLLVFSLAKFTFIAMPLFLFYLMSYFSLFLPPLSEYLTHSPFHFLSFCALMINLFSATRFLISLFLICSLHLCLPVNLLTYSSLAHSLLPSIYHSPLLYSSLYTSLYLFVYFYLSIYLSIYPSSNISHIHPLFHSLRLYLTDNLSINLLIPRYQSPSTSFSHYFYPITVIQYITS